VQNLAIQAPRSYFRRAFSDQHNVILMVGAAVLALAFASFVPALIGVIAEGLFLTIAPRLEAFRDWVDRQDGAARRERVERTLRPDLLSLGPGYGTRLEALSRLLEEVVAGVAVHRALSFAELESMRDGFEQLLGSTLELMRTHQGVLAAIAEIPSLELAQEVARLDRAYAAQRDLELRMGLRQQLLATQKRLAQREELEKTRGKLELQLQTIEKSVGYLKARTSELLAAGQMLNEVRALVSDLAPISRGDGSERDRLGATAAVSAPPGRWR
jgi:hypothetical protein